MYQTIPLIVYHSDHETVINTTMDRLASEGFRVMRSFDLQKARAAQTECICPHHGTEQCNCQMVVFQVYTQDNQLITLIAHGHDDETNIVIVDDSYQHPDPQMVSMIRRALLLPIE